MYNQISSNVWRSRGLIAFFLALIIGLGYLFAQVTDYPEVLPIAVVFAILSSIGSYYYSDRIVLAMSRARPATRDEHAHLVNSVEGLALAAGIPAPRIYVIDDSAPNAFATGRDPERAVICVTTGLMDKLNRVELEGVIGHEMAHIRDYDIRLVTLAAVLAGTVVLISDWLLRSMWWGQGVSRRRRAQGSVVVLPVVLAAAILAPLVATLIQLAISRSREYLADAQGAMLTRFPDGLADALEKIAADTEPLEVANKATAHMYIANPLKDIGGPLNALFSTHPPVEERVRRLRTM
ncbi:MAG TPA: M48 family metallopeptidase [Armatimonadota bacterium]|nr:M48 family metallopeptidase [Armatimonadota bacterium]